MEPAGQPEQIIAGARRPHGKPAGEIQGERQRLQLVSAGGVAAIGADADERERLRLLVLGRVDLKHALAVDEDAVLLQAAEVRLNGRHAPELRHRADRAAQVEDEATRARTHGAELDDVQLSREIERGDLPRGVHFERHLRLERDHRLVEEVRKPQFNAARQLDVEALGLRDDFDGAGRGGGGVALRVLPASRGKVHHDLTGVHRAAEGVAEGVRAREAAGLRRRAVEDHVL